MTAVDSASSALPYTPDIPMQPSPIADTLSPLLPNGRFCIAPSWKKPEGGLYYALLLSLAPSSGAAHGNGVALVFDPRLPAAYSAAMASPERGGEEATDGAARDVFVRRSGDLRNPAHARRRRRGAAAGLPGTAR